MFRVFIFEENLRFARLASLRSVIFSESKEDNRLVTLPSGVHVFIIMVLRCAAFFLIKAFLISSLSSKGEDAGEKYAEEISQVIAKREGKISAYIAESILSCAGQILLPPGYLKVS
jgi:hypothetical protein